MYKNSDFNKHLKFEIEIDEIGNDFNFLKKLIPSDCKYIEDHVSHIALTEESFNSALCFIITYMKHMNWIEFDLDIDKFNKKFAPPTKMSKEEIEKALGYKVEIIDEK